MVPVKSDLSWNDMLRAGLGVPLQDRLMSEGGKVHAQRRKKKPSVMEKLSVDLPERYHITHTVEGEIILQRPQDGYINATDLCQKAGKLFGNYAQLARTQAFLQVLSLDIGIPISNLIEVRRGRGDKVDQGTWVHPRVAINLGQWISPEFDVMVSGWVTDWLSNKTRYDMPVHVQRYIKNREKIPHTHFSMLNEIYFNLFAPLEDHGIIPPDNILPDGSTGKMFSNFLRRKGIDPKEFETYQHEFLDGRIVEARLYPIAHLADFRRYFNEEWLPNHAQDYFAERLPEAVPYLPAIKQLPQA